MKWIHIVAGLLSLISGAVALYAAKGGPWHRRSGTLFVAAMLVMTSSGALMAVLLKPNPVNVMAGLLTAYMVITGWLAVTREVARAGAVLGGLAVAGLALGALGWGLVAAALRSPDGHAGGVPWPPLAMFGSVGVLAGLLDLRLLRAGAIAGKHRIARHLWRMGFAMWVATSSFFLGQPRIFPDYLRQQPMLRALPVIAVAVAVAWFLARTLRRRRTRTAAMVAQQAS